MKLTLHSIAFESSINRLRNCIINDSDIYDVSDKYQKFGYIEYRYLNPCGVEILHFLGRYYVDTSNISHLANNTKNTLHDVAD